MIDRISDLHRHLRQELDIPWIGSARLDTADIENADTSVSHKKRQIDHSSEAFLNVPFVFKEDLCLLQVRTDVYSFMIVHPTHAAPSMRHNGIALEHYLRHRRCHDIKPEPVGFAIILCDRRPCPRNDLR